MSIKMLVTDIDGTLLKYDCTCSNCMKNAILRLNEKNIKVVLASGRMFDGVFPVADFFELKTPVICYQGAMVRNANEILWHKPLQNELARDVIKNLRKLKIHTHLYNDGVLYVEDDDKKIMADYCNNRFVDYKVVKSFDEVPLGEVSKLLACVYDENALLKLQKEMSKKYENKLKVVRSHKYYCEFNDIEASKGNALDFLKEFYNIKTEEIMGCGDQDNDYELLSHSGIKIAMENGTQKLKDIATWVCPNVNDDGLYYAIERYIGL